MRFLLGAIVAAGAGLAVVAISYVLLTGWAETGPGCPGDPEWLGYCHDIRKDG